MYSYRSVFGGGSSIDLFQGQPSVGKWEISLYATGASAELLVGSSTDGALLPGANQGPLTFRVEDPDTLTIRNTSTNSATMTNVHVVITPLVSSSVNLCISPCE